MISALRKISGHSTLAHAPADVREMFIENESSGFSDLFATHPSIEARVAALKAFAGGRDAPPDAPTPRLGPWDTPEAPHSTGPWG